MQIGVLRMALSWLSLLLVVLVAAAADEEAKVEVEGEGPASMVHLVGLGSLQGKTGEARPDKEGRSAVFHQFLGIPYALPPVGELRFRPPEPAAAWAGVRDATEYGAECVQQPYFEPDQVVGQEDCLTLNVFTRSLDPSTSKPVIVWIHGGAFIFGSSRGLSGEYMLEQDVVLVTLQYRLGPFGFLTTADKEAPGNYGLQDQILALRWVQQHIAQFGGNPNLVTLAGMSAGGASVNYLQLSPQADGLFHRAVAMSGSALCWWANLPDQQRTATRLGQALDCPSGSRQMLECLRGKPAREVMAAQASLYAWRHDRAEREPMNIWSPRVDSEAGMAAVLGIAPELAMQAGQLQPVPLLVGAAESEGVWRAANYLTQDAVMLEFMEKFSEVAPHALGLHGQVNQGQLRALLGKVRDFYLSGMTREEDLQKRLESVVSGVINMLGDTMFNYPIDRMVKLQGNKAYSPVWVYQFNYRHNHSIANFSPGEGGAVVRNTGLKQLSRATHAHEIAMLFPVFEAAMGPLSVEEAAQSRKFVKLVTEFAVRGHPKQDGKYEFSEWQPVADGQLSHFVVGKYSGTQLGLPHQPRMKWWNELPAFWKKNSAPQLPVDEEEVHAVDEDVVDNMTEELTEAELEELEASLLAEHLQVKEEL